MGSPAIVPALFGVLTLQSRPKTQSGISCLRNRTPSPKNMKNDKMVRDGFPWIPLKRTNQNKSPFWVSFSCPLRTQPKKGPLKTDEPPIKTVGDHRFAVSHRSTRLLGSTSKVRPETPDFPNPQVDFRLQSTLEAAKMPKLTLDCSKQSDLKPSGVVCGLPLWPLSKSLNPFLHKRSRQNVQKPPARSPCFGFKPLYRKGQCPANQIADKSDPSVDSRNGIWSPVWLEAQGKPKGQRPTQYWSLAKS